MTRHSHFNSTNRHSGSATSKFLANGLVTLLVTLGLGFWVWNHQGEKVVDGELAHGKIRYVGRVASQSLMAIDSESGKHFMLNNDNPVQEASGEQTKNAESLLPATLTSCHDQVEALQLTIAQLQSTNTQLLNDLSAEHIKHRKELGTLRKEVAQLFGELTKEQETNQELLGKVGELEKKFGDATNLIGNLSSENDKLQGKVNSLNDQISTLQDQLNQSNQSGDASLQAQLDATLQENSSLKGQIDSLNSQVSALQVQLADLQATIPDGSQLIQALQDNEQLKLQLTSVNAQLISLQGQVADLTGQNATLQDQLQHATENADAALQSQLDSARDANIALTLQNSALASRVSELSQKLADEAQEVADAQAELDQMNKQVLEMVGRLSGTINQPADSVPAGGIGDASVGEIVPTDTSATPNITGTPDVPVTPDVVVPDAFTAPNIAVADASVIPNVVSTPDTSVIPNILNEPSNPPTIDANGGIVLGDAAIIPNILNEPRNGSDPKTDESTWEHIKHLFWGF